MLGSLLHSGTNDYIASKSSPGHQRFQELARIAGVARAFTLSAKLDLYTVLRDVRDKEGLAGLNSQQIADRLGLMAEPGFRGVTDWLDLLTSISTLERTGTGIDAVYSNTPDADKYLSKQSPDYMAGHAIINHDRTFPQSVWLEDVLRTGQLPDIARQVVAPMIQTFTGAADTSGVTGGDPLAFTLGMTGCNKRPGGKQLVQDFDFFKAAAFPAFDVITMGMILHDWGLQKKLLLMQKFEAENAFDYTFAEFTGWATQIGFSKTELIRLVGPNSAAVAYK
eukprot:gene9279-9444_t